MARVWKTHLRGTGSWLAERKDWKREGAKVFCLLNAVADQHSAPCLW